MVKARIRPGTLFFSPLLMCGYSDTLQAREAYGVDGHAFPRLLGPHNLYFSLSCRFGTRIRLVQRVRADYSMKSAPTRSTLQGRSPNMGRITYSTNKAQEISSGGRQWRHYVRCRPPVRCYKPVIPGFKSLS